MKAKRVKKLDPGRSLSENAARVVGTRIGELHGLAPGALERSNSEQQHDMRIAAKRIRYVLELTGFCFGEVAERARRRAKELQEILGELHDCDVMLPRVERHVATLRKRDASAVRARADEADDLAASLVRDAEHRGAYRGLEMLAVYLEARRELLFDRFRELWRATEEAGTWTELERAARRQLELARERRRAGKPGPESEALAAGSVAAR